MEIRLLTSGDENVVRALRTYDGDGDPEGLLADPRTLMLAAFDDGRPVGFVLAEVDNEPANALYEAVGGTLEGKDAVWAFRYTDS